MRGPPGVGGRGRAAKKEDDTERVQLSGLKARLQNKRSRSTLKLRTTALKKKSLLALQWLLCYPAKLHFLLSVLLEPGNPTLLSSKPFQGRAKGNSA